MLTLSNRSTRSWHTLLNHVEKPLTAVVLTIGLTLVSIAQGYAQTPEALKQSTQVATVPPATLISQRMTDGTYLYGQSQEAFQLGSEYMVFEVNQNQVVGAFYMPNSSFDCFTGEVGNQQISLNIVDSYDQTTHSYAVALRSEGAVASTEDTATPLNLEGFHRIDSLSDLDREILNTCRNNL